MLIKPFADSETERVFHREFSRKLAGDIQAIALRKLRMLSSAHAISDLRSPLGNCLEKLSGDREPLRYPCQRPVPDLFHVGRRRCHRRGDRRLPLGGRGAMATEKLAPVHPGEVRCSRNS